MNFIEAFNIDLSQLAAMPTGSLPNFCIALENTLAKVIEFSDVQSKSI
jgi:hypothetical protein